MSKKKKNFRLYIVGGAFVLISMVLWGRLVQVQVFGRAHYSELAGDQGKHTKTIPAVRGGIFDRAGRPLALSIHSCSISISPKEIEHPDQVADILAKRLSVSKRNIRDGIRSGKSFVWVKRQCSLTKDVQRQLRSIRGVGVHREADRVYPYGCTAAKIVGFVGHDSKGMAGIEAAYDAELRGEPGWEEVQQDGANRSRGYHTYASKKPRNGKHVFLTIDARLQEIAEMELEGAIKKTGARAGTVVLMHCKTGEILALAEYPSARSRSGRSLADSLWTIRSISCVYEPGSTFKLVTAAALLETKKVRSFDVFDGENGRADMDVAVISDAHPFKELTFRDGFVQSSNIVMAKAALKLKPFEFMKFVRLFGFGEKLGIELFGESPGQVVPLDDWSKRTQITMAFGQEIAVTPLQLVNAFAAVANNGVLPMPRVVRAVADENTGETEETEMVELRKVISKNTAKKLREYCRAVVTEGTGTAAGLEFLTTAGKTGTAQKASPNGGYLERRFVSSFVGFAPADEPEVVCLVTLDEPSFKYRFGGVSAAPVFARISEAIAASSHIFDDELTTTRLGLEQSEGQWFEAPNFLRLSREAAMERARMFDLNLLCKGEGGEVIAQEPDPGVAMDRDEVLRVYLSPSADKSKNRKAPDLRGLSLRAAKRRAAEFGLKCDIVGSGYVSKQKPSPGGVSKNGVIRVYCKSATNKNRTG